MTKILDIVNGLVERLSVETAAECKPAEMRVLTYEFAEEYVVRVVAVAPDLEGQKELLEHVRECYAAYNGEDAFWMTYGALKMWLDSGLLVSGFLAGRTPENTNISGGNVEPYGFERAIREALADLAQSEVKLNQTHFVAIMRVLADRNLYKGETHGKAFGEFVKPLLPGCWTLKYAEKSVNDNYNGVYERPLADWDVERYDHKNKTMFYNMKKVAETFDRMVESHMG